MAGFIENFYYGNIDTQEGITVGNQEICNSYEKMSETEKYLLKHLKGEYLEKFRAYVDSSTDFYGLSHAHFYKKGFRQGARFSNDVYAED